MVDRSSRVQAPDHSATRPAPVTAKVLSYELGRLRQSLPRVVGRCMAFSAMARFDEDLVAAVREFYGLDAQVAQIETEILENDEERVRFFPWFLWDFRLSEQLPTVGERFLAEGEHTDHEERLLDALCRSRIGLYEALDDPGHEGARVRDVASDATLHIHDEGLVGELRAGDILQARLVEVQTARGDITLVDSIYAVLPAAAMGPLQVELDGLLGPRPRDPAQTARALKLYVAETLHTAEHLLLSLARPPQARDRAGASIMLAVSRTPSGSEAFTLAAPEAQDMTPGGSPQSWIWVSDDAPPGAVSGLVETRGSGLVLRARNPELLIALERRAAELAGVSQPALRSIEDFDAAVPRWIERGDGGVWLRDEPDVRAAAQAWFLAWIRRWVDMPSSGLGNRTPRQAVRAPDGRLQVERMLRRMDALHRGVGGDAHDMGQVRHELGLPAQEGSGSPGASAKGGSDEAPQEGAEGGTP